MSRQSIAPSEEFFLPADLPTPESRPIVFHITRVTDTVGSGLYYSLLKPYFETENGITMTIKNFSLKKYSKVLSFSVAAIVCFISLKNIGLFNDDNFYKQAAVCDFNIICQFFKWHIRFFNGRTLVHVFAMIFLKFKYGLLLWKIFISSCVGTLCILISDIANIKSKTKTSAFLVVFFFFSVIPYMFADSVYWLTGSFNYFFPSFIIVLLYYFILKEKNIFLTAVLSFLCGASTEQTGLMCVGLLFLLVFNNFIKNKKLPLYDSVNFLMSVLGYLTVILSPGTFRRLDTQSNVTVSSFLYNTLNIIKTVWLANPYVSIIIFSLSILSAAILIKYTKKNRLFGIICRVLSAFLIIFSVLNFISTVFPSINSRLALTVDNSLYNTTAMIIMITFMLLFFICIVISSIITIIYEKDLTAFACLCLAAGSQLMLAVSQNIMLRTAFPAIVWIILLVVYFINLVFPSKILNNNIIRFVFPAITIGVCVLHSFLALINAVPSNNIDFAKLSEEEMNNFTLTAESQYNEYYTSEAWNDTLDFCDFSDLYKF